MYLAVQKSGLHPIWFACVSMELPFSRPAHSTAAWIIHSKKSIKLSSLGMVLSSVLNQGSRLFRSPAVVGVAVSRGGLRNRQHAQHCCQFRGPSGPTPRVATGIHHRSFWDWRGAGKGRDQAGDQGSAKGAGAGSGSSKGVGGKGSPGGSTSEFPQQEEQVAVFS